MEEREMLFSYGTLKEPEIQITLFGSQLEMRPAYLMDWRMYSGDDGYFFIKPENGCRVEGRALYITQDQLRIADRWEEVPVYQRMKTTAYIEGQGACEVEAYTRADGRGSPVRHGGSADVLLEKVVSEAVELKKLILDEKS